MANIDVPPGRGEEAAPAAPGTAQIPAELLSDLRAVLADIAVWTETAPAAPAPIPAELRNDLRTELADIAALVDRLP